MLIRNVVLDSRTWTRVRLESRFLGLGLATCGLGLGLATCGLGLDDFRIRGLGLGLGGRRLGLGLGLATMGLDYISEENILSRCSILSTCSIAAAVIRIRILHLR
jgi:hypothetical protein